MISFKKIIDWIVRLFTVESNKNKASSPAAKPLPPVTYNDISFVEKPPKNTEVAVGKLYCVASSEKIKWSLFRCPCGCGNVITLSLQSIHKPFWKLTKMNSGRPTLHPSVWRNKGCKSHFWIKDGRVFWC